MKARLMMGAVLGAAMLMGGSARADDAYLKAEAVTVTRTQKVPKDPRDAAWAKAPAARVMLGAQRTVRLNDRDANPHRDDAQKFAEVQAYSDGKTLAMRVSWVDPTEDRALYDETSVFGDAVAMEMPAAFGAEHRLPYVGMGDPDENVVVSMIRATTSYQGAPMSRPRTTVAAGFGSLTRAPLPWMDMVMYYDRKLPGWRATFVRPVTTPEHDIARPLVPFALAVWDGAEKQRGGNKSLSRWKVLHDAQAKAEPAYLEKLAYGYGAQATGDAAKGKALATAVCIACHRFAEYQVAPPELAPELTNVGVITNPTYLRDSIKEPSQIIVPVLNLNRHYSKSKERDRYGAYQNDDTYQWFSIDAAGKRVSRMPSFAGFSPEQIADLVAFLQTLGTQPAPKKEGQ
ncbi:MAG: c-type cytochrome [Deltaproteobacteria bacterium]|nr:c-type cytochrome [Deltaproteobacteria bacterium]